MNWWQRWSAQWRLVRELDKVEHDLSVARSHMRRILAMFP